MCVQCDSADNLPDFLGCHQPVPRRQRSNRRDLHQAARGLSGAVQQRRRRRVQGSGDSDRGPPPEQPPRAREDDPRSHLALQRCGCKAQPRCPGENESRNC